MGNSNLKAPQSYSWVLSVGLACILVACANPINRSTYERYRDQAREAEGRRDWRTAEEAYYRAAMNVLRGHLGSDAESEAYFNLGRTKRMVGKLDESEDLLKKSLAIDEKRDAPDASFITSASLGELAATYYEAKKYEEGISLLLRLEPIALKYKQEYSPQARQFLKQVYAKYAGEISRRGKVQEAERFKKLADSL